MLGYKNDGVNVAEFVYDFAVDGGAQGAIDLSGKANKEDLPVGAIVNMVRAKVVTACTSAGSATVVWGPTADPDGYSGATIAVASLTDNALFNGHDNAAALLWDDTNDHAISYNVGAANAADLLFTIATADLTAGKIIFFVEYYVPSLT